MKQLKTSLIAVAMAALVAGCASSGYQKADSTASYLTTAADKLDAGGVQITAATAALTELVEKPQPDMKLQLKNYSTSVDKLESLSKSAGTAATKMQQMGAAYFQKWDEQLSQIQNEEIRNQSAERKAAVMKQFEQTKAAYDAARAAYSPFVANLRDIRTAVSTDLTPAGVQAISKSMTKVNAQAAEVQKTMSDLAAQFRTLSKALEVPTPPPAEKKPASK
jgi:uncharacterized phage infection (PIP) family protein YhgE